MGATTRHGMQQAQQGARPSWNLLSWSGALQAISKSQKASQRIALELVMALALVLLLAAGCAGTGLGCTVRGFCANVAVNCQCCRNAPKFSPFHRLGPFGDPPPRNIYPKARLLGEKGSALMSDWTGTKTRTCKVLWKEVARS